MKKVSESWGTEGPPEISEAIAPMVYQFRPTSYVKIAPDRLREWEAYFAEHVGMPPEQASAEAEGRSASLSGSYDNWDDADFI